MTPEVRLAQARESVEEAGLLWKEQIGPNAVFAKLYHALMNCLFALFDIRIIGGITHADVIERFEREYVRQGVFSESLLGALRRAYDLTHECDCEHMPVPTNEEIRSSMNAAEELVRATEAFLQAGVRP